MKILLSFVSLLLLTINTYCQTDSFNGKEVVPNLTIKCDSEIFAIRHQLYNECNLGDRLIHRDKALSFYHTLLTISEPTTLSGLITDFTYNPDTIWKKPFILNADIQTPIAIGGKRFGMFTIHAIPQFKVRIFRNDPSRQDSSLPVRTPSYMPALVLYFSKYSWWELNEDNSMKGCFWGIKFFHHSDGQDGAEYNSPAPNDDGKINTYNGNFAEDLVGEFIIGHVRQYYGNFKTRVRSYDLVEKGTPTNPNRLIYWKLGYEYHPPATTNANFMRFHLYGRKRLNFQLGYSIIPSYRDLLLCNDKYYAVTPYQSKESWRFVLNVNYLVDGVYNHGDANATTKVPFISPKWRLNLYVTAYRRLTGTQYAAGFLQAGYFGSDNYNMYFQQNFFQVRAGLSFAFFKFDNTVDLAH